MVAPLLCLSNYKCVCHRSTSLGKMAPPWGSRYLCSCKCPDVPELLEYKTGQVLNVRGGRRRNVNERDVRARLNAPAARPPRFSYSANRGPTDRRECRLVPQPSPLLFFPKTSWRVAPPFRLKERAENEGGNWTRCFLKTMLRVWKYEEKRL